MLHDKARSFVEFFIYRCTSIDHGLITPPQRDTLYEPNDIVLFLGPSRRRIVGAQLEE